MKTPFDPTDPFLQILAEDAVDLPLKAAGEARRSRSLEVQRRRQIAITVSVLVCSVCVWQFFPQVQDGQESVAIQAPAAAPIPFPASVDHPVAFPENMLRPLPRLPEPTVPPSPQPSEAMIVRAEDKPMNEPFQLTEGLTEEQASVVKAARGLPLLLVRDSAGKVARIHVIER